MELGLIFKICGLAEQSQQNILARSSSGSKQYTYYNMYFFPSKMLLYFDTDRPGISVCFRHAHRFMLAVFFFLFSLCFVLFYSILLFLVCFPRSHSPNFVLLLLNNSISFFFCVLVPPIYSSGGSCTKKNEKKQTGKNGHNLHVRIHRSCKFSINIFKNNIIHSAFILCSHRFNVILNKYTHVLSLIKLKWDFRRKHTTNADDTEMFVVVVTGVVAAAVVMDSLRSSLLKFM